MENLSLSEHAPSNSTLPILNMCGKNSFSFVFLPGSYSMLFVLSVTGNICVLLHYVTSEKKPSKFFAVNLATLDLLMALTLPLMVDYHSRGRDWRFGEALCTVYLAMFYGDLYGASLFMLCVSVDRLLAVCYPLSYSRWMQRWPCRPLACVCVWLIITGFVLWSSASLQVLNRQPDGTETCGSGFSEEQWRSQLPTLLALGSVVTFFLPYSVILTCYALTAWRLTKPRGVRQRWKSRSLRAIVTVIAIMTASFLPFHIMQMASVAHRLSREPGERYSYRICTGQQYVVLLASLNSALDPFVYYFLSSKPKLSQLCSGRCQK
ncbi:hypothetical protein AAFF_G00046600 [Aldrovandia affinis]|uniref:G-protein coupled receptors family 1 profile domain-containing protein n=1 Tax=Aldrovandia affinis TaxID=143900 RepID=A0AAD7S1U6_9TELE|nr:hypothetical protein AAFF_G00046600 [Aldrovandia affinis]